jgi:hypothetical protein
VLGLFGASAHHCSFYPGSGMVVAAHQRSLARYQTSKGAIRFDADRPLPSALVRKIIKYRIAEHAERRRCRRACEDLVRAVHYATTLVCREQLRVARVTYESATSQ